MRESIFWSGVRSFVVAFFAVVGFLLAFGVMAMVVSKMSETTEATADPSFKVEILPNAKGERTIFSKNVPTILQLNIDGVIGLECLDTQNIRNQLVESREGTLKDHVKAILLHINSPGGTVIDSDGIYRAVKAYKEQHQVPVYAYVDGMCASGAMYIASAADKVFANEVSVVGSVGVISPSFFNASQLVEKLGMQALTLYAGKGKDNLDPFRPWQPGEQEMYQNLINYYYQHFVDIVATNRPRMDREKLIGVYGAAVFPAPEGQSKGYVDASNYDLSKTIKELAQKIGVEDDQYQVVQLEKKTWYHELFGSEFSLFKGTVKHKIELSPAINPEFNSQFLYLYRP